MAASFDPTHVVNVCVCSECGERTVFDGNGGEMCHDHPRASVKTLRAIYRLVVVEPA